jgi:hypothetical protein
MIRNLVRDEWVILGHVRFVGNAINRARRGIDEALDAVQGEA